MVDPGQADLGLIPVSFKHQGKNNNAQIFCHGHSSPSEAITDRYRGTKQRPVCQVRQ
jgi:hypothetical protein